MNIEEIRSYCLQLHNVSESFPFDEVSLVFKVENKMFLLLALDATEPYIAVKCEPQLSIELRENYRAVESAYHFNKKHWNNIYLTRDMSRKEILQWIEHSYHEVIRKLPKRIRSQYPSNHTLLSTRKDL